MSPELIKALVILVVGMLSVFIILGLVVLSGKALILIINRFFPAAQTKSSNISRIRSTPQESMTPSSSELQTPAAHIAAIVAYVEHFTGGKGVVKNIEPLNDGPNKTQSK